MQALKVLPTAITVYKSTCIAILTRANRRAQTAAKAADYPYLAVANIPFKIPLANLV